MKIKMLKTTAGALDGISIKKFEAGIPYSVPDQISQYLADLFLKMGVAKIARERNIFEAPEKAVVEPEEIKVEKIEPKKIEKIIEPEIVKEKPVMRVYQLAEELSEINNSEILSKDIIKLAKELGIHAPAPQSGLSEKEVSEIKKGLS